ncbi:Serine/threonine-protein kinase HT1 [Vitis vinifera]|uniref:non-specific serine/threonine protein kinase n=1 Tax=Vitis vinifera TaxID=29760 RepID=A0A438KHM3_VITVI|nr:Serine/threonine-protein kinase HT1 [Vitis vinifera]
MDLRSDDEVLVTAKAEKSRTGEGETVSDKSSISSSDLGSKKDGGNTSNKDLFLRADKIDFKSWDIQLDKHLSRVISRDREVNTNTKKEDWEIELSKLDIRSVIAHGHMVLCTEAFMMAKMLQVCIPLSAFEFVLPFGMPASFPAFKQLTRNEFYLICHEAYVEDRAYLKLLDWGEDGLATAAETAALRTSFRQEVAVWHKLDHPNVTKFIGASMGTSDLRIPSNSISSDGRNPVPSRACCVVVEYLPGGTLKKFLIRNRRKKLAFKIVIQLALDLSRGLSYLHSKKIVHRDVKTENMLLDAHRTLKIADFGVARVEAQNPRDMTGETGTLGYMAPERHGTTIHRKVLDGKPYNRKCDVYSFGICLWETYCCDMPYPDLSFADISSAVVRQNLRPDIPRCCPSSLASIMRKCWDGNPDKRPDMDEVVRLLEAIDTSKGGGMIPEDQVSSCCFFSVARGP